MNTEMLKHVREMWNVSYVPPHINRANQRKWIRAVRQVGDKWLLKTYVEKQNDKS